MSAKRPRQKIKWDLWMIVTVAISAFYLLFLLYPLISMLSKSVIGEDGGFTWAFFQKVFSKKYYQRAILGSLKISATVTLITVLIATPLAYIMSTIRIKGAGILQILILVSSMSAPFIGAYAWIMLCGRNGTITNLLLNTFGIQIGDIYGFKGCVIVMSLQLYSLVYMFVSGAFKNMVAELKKVAWPSKKDLINYSIVVIGFVVGLALIVGLLDTASSFVVKQLIEL